MALLLVGMEGALEDRRGKGHCSKACWVWWFHLKASIEMDERDEMEEESCSMDLEDYIWDNNSCLVVRLESFIFCRVVIGIGKLGAAPYLSSKLFLS